MSKATEERTIESLSDMVHKDKISRLEKLLVARLLAEEGYVDRAVKIYLSLGSLEEIRKLAKVCRR